MDDSIKIYNPKRYGNFGKLEHTLIIFVTMLPQCLTTFLTIFTIIYLSSSSTGCSKPFPFHFSNFISTIAFIFSAILNLTVNLCSQQSCVSVSSGYVLPMSVCRIFTLTIFCILSVLPLPPWSIACRGTLQLSSGSRCVPQLSLLLVKTVYWSGMWTPAHCQPGT